MAGSAPEMAEEQDVSVETARGNSFDKLLRLLELFSTYGGDHLSVDEAAHQLGMSASHTYRYFRSLVNAGFITSYTPGRYLLGPAIIELDRKMRISDPMIQAARSKMPGLLRSAPANATAILCRYFRGQVMCIHEEFTTRMEWADSYERGQPRPLYQGAASKAILAHLPLRQVKSYFEGHTAAFARFGLGEHWLEVKQQLRVLRARSTIYTCGELGGGAAGISAPIFDDKRVIGSISLVIPEAQATADVIEILNSVVADAARKMTDEMRRLAVG